jgi:hypothetical protein
VPDDQLADGGAVGPKSHADAHLQGALLDRVGHQAVDADGGEDECGGPEDGQQEHVEVLVRGGLDDNLAYGTHAGDGEPAAGLLNIRMEPLGVATEARIATPGGVFAGRDHRVSISYTQASQ